MDLAFAESDGNFATLFVPNTYTGSKVWTAPPASMTLTGFPAAPTAANCLTEALSTTLFTLGCSGFIDNGTVATYSGSGGVSAIGYTATGSGAGADYQALGTGPGGLSGFNLLYADSSTAREILCFGTTTPCGIIPTGPATGITAGHLATWNSNLHDLVDGGAVPGNPANIFTSGANTGIGPAATSPGHTLDLRDTSNTTVWIYAAPGQGSDDLFHVQDSNSAGAFVVNNNDTVTFRGIATQYNGNNLLDQGFANVLCSTDTTYQNQTANLTAASYCTTGSDGINPQLWQMGCNADVKTTGATTSFSVTLNWTSPEGVRTQALISGMSFAAANSIGGVTEIATTPGSTLTLTTAGYTAGAYDLYCTGVRIR
jgi:hypothetical protein